LFDLKKIPKPNKIKYCTIRLKEQNDKCSKDVIEISRHEDIKLYKNQIT